MTDSHDSPSYGPTPLDKEKLTDLKPGDLYDGECGMWRVLCYKTDYALIVNSKKKEDFQFLTSVSDIISYLNGI